MKTLRSRLLRTLTLVLFVLFAAEWLLLTLAIRHVNENAMLVHLEHDGEGLLDALELRAGGLAWLDPRAVESVYRSPRSGHYFVVRIAEGSPQRSESLEDFALSLEPPRGREQWDYRTAGPDGQSLIVRAMTRTVEGAQVNLYVAEDESGIREEIGRLSLVSLAVFLPLLGGALLLQGIAVGRALRPLVGVRDELREVGAGRHAQIQADVPQEIKPLVDELNRLLVMLHRRLKQSRSALGNLAHALKTPLAILLRTAEDASVGANARDTLQSQVRVIRQRLERELRRARLAGPVAAGAGAWFNPHVELHELTRALGAIYSDKHIEFSVSAPDVLLPFDREDMLELFGNLADNACKWAHARVTLTVAELATPDSPLEAQVCDDGPGLAEGERAEVLGRGVRLDESTPGHGLGLAIVQDIVELYAGSLAFDRAPALEGLRARVTLPRPAAAL